MFQKKVFGAPSCAGSGYSVVSVNCQPFVHGSVSEAGCQVQNRPKSVTATQLLKIPTIINREYQYLFNTGKQGMTAIPEYPGRYKNVSGLWLIKYCHPQKNLLS